MISNELVLSNSIISSLLWWCYANFGSGLEKREILGRRFRHKVYPTLFNFARSFYVLSDPCLSILISFYDTPRFELFCRVGFLFFIFFSRCLCRCLKFLHKFSVGECWPGVFLFKYQQSRVTWSWVQRDVPARPRRTSSRSEEPQSSARQVVALHLYSSVLLVHFPKNLNIFRLHETGDPHPCQQHLSFWQISAKQPCWPL